MHKKLLIFLLLFGASNAHPAATSLDLHHATTTGIAQRPLLKAASQNIAQSKAYEYKATAAYLPQLSASHTTLFDQEKSLDTTTHTLSLHGSQLIFDPAGPLLQRKIAAHATTRARHTYTATTNTTRHEIALAFFDAWLLQEKAPLITATRELLIADSSRAIMQHEMAQNNIHMLASTQATNAQRQATIDAYEHEIETAWATLQRLIGDQELSAMPYLHYHMDVVPGLPRYPLLMDPGSEAGMTKHEAGMTKHEAGMTKHEAGMTDHRAGITKRRAGLDPVPTSFTLRPLQYYLDRAIALRPELKASQVAHQEHTLAARQQRLGYLPRVSMHAGLGKTFAGTTSSRGTDASLSLTASWSFFDGMQRSHAAHAADAAALRTQFEQQELRNTIAQQVRTAYHKIGALQSAENAAHALYEAEQGQWQQDHTALQLGSIDHRAYTKRCLTYQTAAHTWRTTHIDLQKQYETLAYHSGYPPEMETEKGLL